VNLAIEANHSKSEAFSLREVGGILAGQVHEDFIDEDFKFFPELVSAFAMKAFARHQGSLSKETFKFRFHLTGRGVREFGGGFLQASGLGLRGVFSLGPFPSIRDNVPKSCTGERGGGDPRGLNELDPTVGERAMAA